MESTCWFQQFRRQMLGCRLRENLKNVIQPKFRRLCASSKIVGDQYQYKSNKYKSITSTKPGTIYRLLIKKSLWCSVTHVSDGEIGKGVAEIWTTQVYLCKVAPPVSKSHSQNHWSSWPSAVVSPVRAAVKSVKGLQRYGQHKFDGVKWRHKHDLCDGRTARVIQNAPSLRAGHNYSIR